METMTTIYVKPTPEEFLAQWERKIRTAIRQFGFYGEDEDDIFQDLMEEWFRDGLNRYDPTRAAMSTFLYGFVNVRLYAYNRKRRTFFAKNIDIDDSDERLGVEEDYIDAELLDRIRKVLSCVPTRGKRDLLRLFNDLLIQIERNGIKNQSAIAETYGVSPAAITTQMIDLRDALVATGAVELDHSGGVAWK